MKYVAIFMVLLVVCAAALGIYTYVNVRLEVVSVTLKAESATERPNEFLSLQQQMETGALIGTPFSDALPGTGGDYSFFTYTFRLKNNGLIDAEMVEIQPLPANGDVLSYMTLNGDQVNAGLNVSAGSERDAWCVLLTSAQNQQSHAVARSFRITYYVWGIPVTVNVAYK